jgi:hypothetical protein
LIGGDFLPATGSLQAYFTIAPESARIDPWRSPADPSRIDSASFKP